MYTCHHESWWTGGEEGKGGCYFAISSNIRNRWARSAAFFAASRSFASDPRSKGRVKPVSAIRFRDDDAIFVKEEIVRGSESMLSDFFFFFFNGEMIGFDGGKGEESFCFSSCFS